jgi:3',5'-cyclic-AMP phosphodiesterase
MPTVLQLSDTHLTSDGRRCYDRDPTARLQVVIEAWRATGRHVDLVLLTGDIADDGSDGGCRAAAALVAAVGAPVFAIPGNHDTHGAFQESFRSESEVELEGWRILGVDSVIPGEVDGAVSAVELFTRLDALDPRPTVVAVHHPPWSPSRHHWFRLDNGDDLVAGLLARPQVRAVVSGHLHQPFEERRDGLALLGAPSTLYGIRHVDQTFEPDQSIAIGARVLDLQPGGDVRTELFVA